MRTPSAQARTRVRSDAHHHHLPAELASILGAGACLLAVVGAGAGISALLPEPVAPWLFAAAYAAPGAVAFTIYWWIAQRL